MRDALTSLGARVVTVTFPDYQSAIDDWGPLCAIEAAYAHRKTFPARRAEYGPTLREFLDLADGISAADYQAILLRRRRFSGELEAMLNTVDALLIPAQTPRGAVSPDSLYRTDRHVRASRHHLSVRLHGSRHAHCGAVSWTLLCRGSHRQSGPGGARNY